MKKQITKNEAFSAKQHLKWFGKNLQIFIMVFAFTWMNNSFRVSAQFHLPAIPSNTQFSNQFEYSAEYIYRVKSGSNFLEDGAILAYVDGQLRGAQTASVLFPPTGIQEYKIRIFSNTNSGDQITFKYYDVLHEKVYDITEYESFTSDNIPDYYQPAILNAFCGPTEKATGLLPENLAENQDANLNLFWEPSANTTYYNLYLWKDGTSEPTKAFRENITGTSTKVDNLSYGDTYHWYVVSANQCGEAVSNRQTFKVRYLPDLIVSNMSSPDTSLSGTSIELNYTVTNQGRGAAGSTWIDAIFISDDAVFSGDDKLLGQFENKYSLEPDSSYTQSVTISFPPDFTGNHYLFCRTNQKLNLPESDQGNNTIQQPNQLYIKLKPLPDVRVTGISSNKITLQPTDTFDISWKVENIGDAPATGGWTEKISIVSLSGARLNLVGTPRYTEVLNNGSIISRTYQFILPEILSFSGEATIEVELVPSNELIEYPGNEANNLATSPGRVTVTNRLYLTIPESVKENYTGDVRCYVTRSGNFTDELSVNLSASLPGQINIPSTLTIPARNSSIVFNITPIDNSQLDGTRGITVTASASGFSPVLQKINILDDEVPAISLVFNKDTASEGDKLMLTLSSGLAIPDPVTFYLSTNRSSQWTFPDEVVIEPNQTSATIEVEITDNTIPELNEEASITARSEGMSTGTVTAFIMDDDIPVIELEILTDTVSEGAGPYATWGVIHRTANTSCSVKVNLSASSSNSLFFPASVTLDKDATQKQFNIGVVDNAQVDGFRTIEITGAIYISSCNCSTTPENGGVVKSTLTIVDNDGPSLSVTINPASLKEGISNAGTMSIFRNTETSIPLEVSLFSNDTSEISLPETITIPAGETTVQLPIDTKDDQIDDGNQMVTLQADASGFSPGMAWVYVTDINKPDLEMTDIELSKNSAVANSQLEVHALILNNGYGTAPSGVKVKLYLSKDEKIDDNDSIIYKSSLPDPLPMGQSTAYLELITVPSIAGDYYILAKVNPELTVSELLYINNESGSVPLSILPSYNGLAMTDEEILTEPAPVPISGLATLMDGNPAANVDLDVYIISDGIRRVLEVSTDEAGNFSTIFEPFSYESGHYSIGACFPGQDLDEEQDAFDIMGMERVSKDYFIWNIKKDVPVSGKIEIKNRSNVPLHNITFSSDNLPNGCQINIDTISLLPGAGIAEFSYTVEGLENTAGINYIEFPVVVNASEGVSFEFTGYYYCQSLASHLECKPASINTTMTKAKSRYFNLQVVNNGAGETGHLSVELPKTDWMSLVSVDTLETLFSGDTLNITLMFVPNNEIPLNIPLTGRMVVHITNGDDLVIPYQVENVSEETGSLRVDVVDEYTYYTEDAPHVRGAHVVIRHPYSGMIMAEGFTDANGIFEVENLAEGSYKMTVEVDKHEGYQNVIVIDPGRVNEQSVFLSFQAITYTWEVVPTEIEDEYQIDLVMEYETNVPAPVVIMEMPKEMPQLTGDETYTFMVTLTNKGLITAKDVELVFPQDNPTYEWIFNFPKMELLAQQSIQVPVVMQIKSPNKSAHIFQQTSIGSPLRNGNSGYSQNGLKSGGGCTDYAMTIYGFECGLDQRWHTTSHSFTFTGTYCPQAGTDLPDFGGGTGPGGGAYTGGYAGASQPFVAMSSTGCDPCLIAVAGAGVACYGGAVAGAVFCVFSFADGDLFSWGAVADAITCIPKRVYGCPANVASAFMTCYAAPPWRHSSLKNSSSSFRLDDMNLKNAPPIMLQAVYDLQHVEYYDSLIGAYYTEYFGALDWESKESIGDFTMAIDSIVKKKLTFNIQASEAIKAYMQGTDISEEEINVFINRWNRSMEAWGKGIYSPNSEYPDIIDHTRIDYFLSEMNTIYEYALSQGYESVSDMYIKAYDTLKEEAEGGRSSVCASVSIKISQKLVMTREAFEGTLTIFNGNTTTPMENVKLNLEIRNETGELCNDLFQIDTKALSVLTGIDGSGTLGANQKGSATVLFIPEKGAAPELPVSYSFGGSFSYLDPFTDKTVTKPLYPVTLQVSPSPDLFLHYFMQRDILGDDALTKEIFEPIVPAELAVMIVNNGYGTAKSVRIESAQPEIIDNEKGLAIHFALIGSNLNGQPRQLGLTNIDFGNIAPKTSSIGQWWFTSDLLGHFVNYETNVTHLDSRGNPDLSLISGAELHELIKSIRVYGDTDDGINDFLVNGVQDAQEQPDAIYMSQGNIVLDVSGADAGLFDGTIQSPDFTNTLNITASKIGWNYIKLSDPGSGKYEIASVTRNSDHQEIPLDNAWLTYVTLPDGKEPIYENKFHLVDFFKDPGEQEYTIVWKLKDPNPPAVLSIEGTPQSVLTQQVTSVTVKFNKEIDPATFTWEDMMLRLQGGENNMNSSVVVTKLDSVTYSVDLSALTTGNGFYVLTVQAAEIADLGGTFGKVGKQASWSQFLSVPAVEEFIGLPEINTESGFDYILVRFNLPIDVNTLTSSRFILLKDGNPVSGALSITLMDTEARLFRLSGLSSLMDSDGLYTLTVDLPNIATINGEKGLLQQSVEWTIDTTPPEIVSFAKVTDGGFDNQHATGMEILFSEDVSGFDLASLELWKDGQQQPLSQVHIDSMANHVYQLSQFRLLTYYPGTYTLTVNMDHITDKAGISGTGIREYQWTVDRTQPNPVENLRITPDLGYSDNDGITSVREITAIMDVIDPGTSIKLYKNDFGTLILLADSSNVMAGELALPIKITSPGNVLLEVHCVDSNQNFSVTQLPVVIDESALLVSWKEVPQEPAKTQPASIKLEFSGKILESSLEKSMFTLQLKGKSLDISDLTIQKVSDSLFTVSGFENLEYSPGTYTFNIDLRKTHKYLSGLPGTYISSATWTLLDINEAPEAYAGEDFNILLGETYQLDASGSLDPDNDNLDYQWFPPEGIALDDVYSAYPSFTVPEDTNAAVFTFILWVSDGQLSSTDKVNAYLSNASKSSEPVDDSRIILFPNPCTGYFTLSVHHSKVKSIRIIDLSGKVILNRIWKGEKEQIINLGKIPGGMYFVQINTEEKRIMKKIIVR